MKITLQVEENGHTKKAGVTLTSELNPSKKVNLWTYYWEEVQKMIELMEEDKKLFAEQAEADEAIDPIDNTQQSTEGATTDAKTFPCVVIP